MAPLIFDFSNHRCTYGSHLSSSSNECIELLGLAYAYDIASHVCLTYVGDHFLKGIDGEFLEYSLWLSLISYLFLKLLCDISILYRKLQDL